MIGKIYKVTNLINGKIYVGQTIQNDKRGHGKLLAMAYRKYGKENFSYDILEECPVSLLDDREKFYIKHLNSFSGIGYNLTSGGKNGMSGWNKGHTKYTNHSIYIQGQKHKNFRKNNFWSGWNKGLTKETCNVLLYAGIKQSITKRRTGVVAWNKGLRGMYSMEQINILRESGRKTFTENNPMKSEESRKKVSDSKKGRTIYIDSEGNRKLTPRQDVK